MVDSEVPAGPDRLEFERRLAEVNLLRLRGNYAEAQALGDKLLAASPRDIMLILLMGEIARGRGDLNSAQQWFLMATEVDPADANAREHLRAVNAELHRSRQSESEQRLGLNNRPPNAILWAGLTILTVCGLIYAGFWFGNQKAAPANGRVERIPIEVSLVVPPNQTNATSAPERPVTQEPATGVTQTPEPTPRIDPVMVTADSQIERAIREKLPFADQFISAQYDPRTQLALLTFTAPESELRGRLTTIAAASLEALPDIQRVAIRLVRTREIVALGEIKRTEPGIEATVENYWEAAASPN